MFTFILQCLMEYTRLSPAMLKGQWSLEGGQIQEHCVSYAVAESRSDDDKEKNWHNSCEQVLGFGVYLSARRKPLFYASQLLGRKPGDRYVALNSELYLRRLHVILQGPTEYTRLSLRHERVNDHLCWTHFYVVMIICYGREVKNPI